MSFLKFTEKTFKPQKVIAIVGKSYLCKGIHECVINDGDTTLTFTTGVTVIKKQRQEQLDIAIIKATRRFNRSSAAVSKGQKQTEPNSSLVDSTQH